MKFILVVAIMMLFATMFSVLYTESSSPLTGAVTNIVSATTTATVTVLPLYNISVDIKILNKVVNSGESLFVLVNLAKTDLTKVKSSPRINVDLNYEILVKNKVVKTGFIETIPIIKSDRDTVSISIPSDFSGSYDLRIIATESQAYTASDKDSFLVNKKFKYKC
jgi:hypothetical protein